MRHVLTSHHPDTAPVIGRVEERDGERVAVIYSEQLAKIAAERSKNLERRENV
jgi:hypothetical protein